MSCSLTFTLTPGITPFGLLMISATDGLFNAALFKHHILPCSPIRLSQFVVNIRCRQLFHWQQVNTPELSGESSKNKQTSAGVKIPRSSLCAASASLFASPLLSLQHKAFVYKLCKPSLQQPCIPQASIFPSTSPC